MAMPSKQSARKARQKSGVDRSLSRIREGTDLADDAVGARILNTTPGAEAVITAAIRDLNVTADKLGNNSVGARALNTTAGAEAVVTGAIRAGAVTTPKIADGHVTADKLGDNSIGARALNKTAGAEGVTTATIRDLNVTNPKLGDNSVNRRTINLTDLYVALDARYVNHGETVHGNVHALTAPALLFTAFLFSQTNAAMAWALLAFACLFLTAQLMLAIKR